MGNRLGRSRNKKPLQIPVLGIRVVHPDSGRLLRYPPTSSALYAGEVMLEHPNHYLCCLSDLQIGRRMSPIPADRCLESAHIYVLLPMRRLRSRVSQEDLAFFSASLNPVADDINDIDRSADTKGESSPHKRSKSRVLPLMASKSSPPMPYNLAQYGGKGEKDHLQGCLDSDTNLHQTMPLFRCRSLGLGMDWAMMEEDEDDVLVGQVVRMRRALSWMPKLEPIGESDQLSDNDEENHLNGMSQDKASYRHY